MNEYNHAFWNALDELVNRSEIIIDRPKGTAHPKYPNFIYKVDYGYLKNTTSMDGGGIDVWVGSGGKNVNAVMCIVDLMKKDSEIKILIGCTEQEQKLIYETHNEMKYMKGILIQREAASQGGQDEHQMKSERELLKNLAEAENDVREGRVAPMQETFEDMYKQISKNIFKFY